MSTFEDIEFAESFISPADLKKGKQIGNGASGITYLGEWQGKKVVIKEYSQGVLQNDSKSVNMEIKLMMTLSHPNIIRFCGCSKTNQDQPSLVTEYAENGQLKSALYHTKIVKKGGDALKFQIAIGLANGLRYLHSKNVIHRDIKPTNILLDHNCQPMLTDFGFSRFVEASGHMTGETGSYKYMAPEITKHEPYDERADIFSYAVLINEVFSEERPYQMLLPLHAALGVAKNNIRPDQKKYKDPEVKELIAQCWDTSPNKRPSWDVIIETFTKCSARVKDVDKKFSFKALFSPRARQDL